MPALQLILMMTENLENISRLQDAYDLLGVDNALDLSKRYTEEDRKLMKSGQWDYDNADLITNKMKGILEQIDPMELTDEEQEWLNEILWFWYHHAISCAVHRYQDKKSAQEYSVKALEYLELSQPDPEDRNQITYLLFLLVNDKFDEAKSWTDKIIKDYERKTAHEIIEEWPSIKFKE